MPSALLKQTNRMGAEVVGCAPADSNAGKAIETPAARRTDRRETACREICVVIGFIIYFAFSVEVVE